LVLISFSTNLAVKFGVQWCNRVAKTKGSNNENKEWNPYPKSDNAQKKISKNKSATGVLFLNHCNMEGVRFALFTPLLLLN
jgi:intein-encoded DNA endonuclease-like protein